MVQTRAAGKLRAPIRQRIGSSVRSRRVTGSSRHCSTRPWTRFVVRGSCYPLRATHRAESMSPEAVGARELATRRQGTCSSFPHRSCLFIFRGGGGGGKSCERKRDETLTNTDKELFQHLGSCKLRLVCANLFDGFDGNGNIGRVDDREMEGLNVSNLVVH